MQLWIAITSFFALLVAVGTLIDRHYTSHKTTSKIREALIRFYLWFDKRFQSRSVAFAGLSSGFAVVALLFGGLLAWGSGAASVYLSAALERSDGVLEFVLQAVIGFLFAKSGIVAGACVILSLQLLGIVVRTVTGFVVLHVTDKASDPRSSPFTYVLTLLGVIVALSKFIVDLAKLRIG
jgi:hypothetical protein